MDQCTYEVVVTGFENENDIALRVEELKNTSRLVNASPDGITYKNINIWASSRRIKEALLRCKVENSWIKKNGLETDDIKILRWNAAMWQQLDTKEIKNDKSFTYYEARTSGFAHFAVTGLKEKEEDSKSGTEIKETEKPKVTPTPLPQLPRKSNFAWIIYVLIGLVILSGLYFYIKKKKG